MYFNVCPSAFEGSGVEVHVDSRLMILRCGLNYDQQLQRNVPDAYYFVLEGQRFRELAHLHGKRLRAFFQNARNRNNNSPAKSVPVT